MHTSTGPQRLTEEVYAWNSLCRRCRMGRSWSVLDLPSTLSYLRPASWGAKGHACSFSSLCFTRTKALTFFIETVWDSVTLIAFEPTETGKKCQAYSCWIIYLWICHATLWRRVLALKKNDTSRQLWTTCTDLELQKNTRRQYCNCLHFPRHERGTKVFLMTCTDVKEQPVAFVQLAHQLREI